MSVNQVRNIQHSINEDFKALSKNMREIELEFVDIAKSHQDGTLISSSLPLMIATVNLANQASTILSPSMMYQEMLLESNSISEAIMGQVRILFTRLINACQDNYAKDINSKGLLLVFLISTAAALTGIAFVVMIILVLKVVSKKNTSIASLAYIPDADIRKIITTSQNVSMRDPNYKVELITLKDEDSGNDINIGTNKGTVQNRTVLPLTSTQDPVAQSVTNVGEAANQAVPTKDFIRRKYDYIRFSEYSSDVAIGRS
eukprot:TRINITY_DN13342_c0_g1_i2.p1 TRINITY_DN13342_c0_g1~~TRINITY_DN13342_c0_g1_i2.p1  ORF type:complete len:259 (+),score=67.78 TRINITY_DN13342_c0_g1_i2:329-1105(+)